jgi:hypothetical protein
MNICARDNHTRNAGIPCTLYNRIKIIPERTGGQVHTNINILTHVRYDISRSPGPHCHQRLKPAHEHIINMYRLFKQFLQRTGSGACQKNGSAFAGRKKQ